MSDESAEHPSRWAPFLPSLVVAVGAVVWLIGSSIVITVIGELPKIGTGLFSPHLERLVDLSSLIYPAFGLALLFSFWLMAPINGALGFRQLILRVLAAAGVLVVVGFPVEFIVYAQYFADLGSQSDISGGIYGVQPGYTQIDALAYGAAEAVQVAISRLPLIAIAAIASWAWQKRSTAHGET